MSEAPLDMSDETFEAMAKLEEQHWWFEGKRRLVVQELRRELGMRAPGGLALDVGCGTGRTLAALAALDYRPVGTDLSVTALGHAQEALPPTAALVRAVAEQLPLPPGSVDCLVSLDVVEHLDDDVRALREYRRVLCPDGVLIVAVPAYQWAWSDHDVQLGHRRRYTRTEIAGAAIEAGLDVRRVTHFHSWLVPPAMLLRRTPLRRLVRKGAEEASFVNARINAWFARLTLLERRVLVRRDLAAGMSIMLVARPG